MIENNPTSFESQIDIVNEAIRKRKRSWHLHAINDFDFDDVAQKLRIHIWVKWEQWDPEKGPLQPWLNKIITRQMVNIRRDHYYKFTKPCVSCVLSEDNRITGDDTGCKMFGQQSIQCPLYAKWIKSKKHAFNIKVTLPLDNHIGDVAHENNQNESFDYEEIRTKLHERLLPKLTKTQKKVYILLYIDEKSEDEVAKIMGYKSNEANKRKRRYKQISNYIKLFKEKSKQILDKYDIFNE